MKNQEKAFVAKWLVIVPWIFIIGCDSPADKTGQDATGTINAKPIKHSVEISMMKFNPAMLNVRKGDSIVFVNNDIVTHDITEEQEQVWSSSPMPAGKTWVLVAIETVDYYCSIHPVMKGKIIVE